MTLAERLEDAHRRRGAHFAMMQDTATHRNTLNQQLADAQVALTKIDGEIEVLERMIAEDWKP